MTTSILVTGGTGTLGRPVAQRLRDAGAEGTHICTAREPPGGTGARRGRRAGQHRRGGVLPPGDRPRLFYQRIRQGPGLRKMNGNAPNGVQPAVSPHVACENVPLIQLRLGPPPSSSPIQQLPDCCELRADMAGILTLDLSQDADYHGQAHGGASCQ
jgi:NAD(P)-dependent dehydrogenase (short-subunit alcohol dehydrogenase family)